MINKSCTGLPGSSIYWRYLTTNLMRISRSYFFFGNLISQIYSDASYLQNISAIYSCDFFFDMQNLGLFRKKDNRTDASGVVCIIISYYENMSLPQSDHNENTSIIRSRVGVSFNATSTLTICTSYFIRSFTNIRA